MARFRTRIDEHMKRKTMRAAGYGDVFRGQRELPKARILLAIDYIYYLVKSIMSRLDSFYYQHNYN
jgi:hypothetical protein